MSIFGTAAERITFAENDVETHSAQASNDNGEHPSEDELLASAREGDAGALTALFARHRGRLLRLAERIVRDRNDAEEVLQEVLVTAWRKLPGFDGRSQVGSWLYRVTINASLMLLRTRRRRAADMPADERVLDISNAHNVAASGLAGRPERPDEQLESSELMGTIGLAMAQLPRSLHDVFVERHIEGKNTVQTAQSLGLTTAAVKTRLFRARVLLREKVELYLAQ